MMLFLDVSTEVVAFAISALTMVAENPPDAVMTVVPAEKSIPSTS
jgi:hypothetical protein